MAVLLKYYLLNRNIFKMKKILQIMDHYLMYNDVMKAHAFKLLPDNEKAKVLDHIPIAAPEDLDFSKGSTSDIPVIAVPGYIDMKRRDYSLVFRVLEKLKSQLTSKIIVKFLGKPVKKAGYEILAKLKGLNSKNLEIITHNNRLDQRDFKVEMVNSTLLLSPLTINTRYDLYKEVYGQTKASGIEDDIIRYQKPVIIPEMYNCSELIQPFLIKYGNEDELFTLLLDISNHKLKLLSSEEILDQINADNFFSALRMSEVLNNVKDKG